MCTVPAQALPASNDRHLIEVCGREGRALVTLDVDFANPLVYPPADLVKGRLTRTGWRAAGTLPFQGMAKTRKAPVLKRSDAERRARQEERFSRLLRTLHRIMGPGRWDADALARELEVSPRTVHRLMQTLSMANVPWYCCKEDGCYRVRPGFRFPGVDGVVAPSHVTNPLALKGAVETLLAELTRTVRALKCFSDDLSNNGSGSAGSE